ncbi:hypothetical protein [Streptomyces sp. NBC_00986]|uniref:hypothetical protein n=1 Tax=Streptomyces sp. NBC_00986 TaxID=2903702 RepID=UPI00386C9132|nr:hypothetical protein OG504_52020 [Streptomyces sp. NBC_00986]
MPSQGGQFAVCRSESGLQLGTFFTVFAAAGGRLLDEAVDQRTGGSLSLGGVSCVARDGITSCPAERLDLRA